MPPKGWRKNAEGQYPQPSSKENELISIDDILFPRTTVQKLAKNIISDNDENATLMTIAKDSLLALQRSATVFVSHLFFQAKEISKEANRKTVSAQDMLGALERAEFSGFLPEIKQKLTRFEELAANKKQQKANGSNTKEIEDIEESDKKRLKVNESSGTSVSKNGKGTGEEEDDNDDEEEEDGDNNNADDEDDDDDEEEEHTKVAGEDEDDDDMDVDDEEEAENPISALAKEEEELEGENFDEKHRSSDNEDDSEDDEDE